MEGWCNTRPNPPIIQITTVRLWEIGIPTFHSPVRLQGLEKGQQLEKEVASNQVSRLDVELWLLAAIAAPLPCLWDLLPVKIPCPGEICQDSVVKCVFKKV